MCFLKELLSWAHWIQINLTFVAIRRRLETRAREAAIYSEGNFNFEKHWCTGDWSIQEISLLWNPNELLHGPEKPSLRGASFKCDFDEDIFCTFPVISLLKNQDEYRESLSTEKFLGMELS